MRSTFNESTDATPSGFQFAWNHLSRFIFICGETMTIHIYRWNVTEKHQRLEFFGHINEARVFIASSHLNHPNPHLYIYILCCRTINNCAYAPGWDDLMVAFHLLCWTDDCGWVSALWNTTGGVFRFWGELPYSERRGNWDRRWNACSQVPNDEVARSWQSMCVVD